MKTIIRGGIILGLLVTVFIVLHGALGLHKNLGMAWLFPTVATLIEIVVLVWALRQTAAQGRRYFGQVSAGTMLAFVGGALIFGTSYLYQTMFQPNFVTEMNAAWEAAYRAQGLDEAAIQAKLATLAPSLAAGMQAVTGFAATVITGLVASLLIAIGIRSRGPQAA